MISFYHTDSPIIRQESYREKAVAFATAFYLLLPEGLAVGALVHGRILLMGANQDLVQRAVVLMAAVMGALLDSAFDALVCVTVHKETSFELDSGIVWTDSGKLCRKLFPMLPNVLSCAILYI